MSCQWNKRVTRSCSWCFIHKWQNSKPAIQSLPNEHLKASLSISHALAKETHQWGYVFDAFYKYLYHLHVLEGYFIVSSCSLQLSYFRNFLLIAVLTSSWHNGKWWSNSMYLFLHRMNISRWYALTACSKFKGNSL